MGLAESADFGLDLSRPANAAAATTADLDDWQLAEDLKQLRQTLHSAADGLPQITPPGYPPTPTASRESYRSAMSAARHEMEVLPSVSAAGPTPRVRPRKRRGVVAWIVTWLGLATCMCGVALLGLSFAEQRSDLWNLGLPITLAGQFGLLCGLIMQMDRIRHDSSQTAEELGYVGERLHEIKESTALLATPSHAAGGAFYAHLAQGASPQLLLADLKGQLDLLAVRLASSR
jgi:hypothetical protein